MDWQASTDPPVVSPIARDGCEGGPMSSVEQTIDVEAPIRAVYDQWTQFESFLRFVDGVERVVQIDL
jgi:uncharacterized membrane protein